MRYQKTVAALAKAEAAVERWTVKTIRAAARLDDARKMVAKIKRRLAAKEGDAAIEICGYCGYVNADCHCPPEVKSAGA